LQTVIVGDDCALPPPRGIAGRRGLAGTIFVHKVIFHWCLRGFLLFFFLTICQKFLSYYPYHLRC